MKLSILFYFLIIKICLYLKENIKYQILRIFQIEDALLAERSMRMVQVHIIVRWRRFEPGKAQS